MHTVTERKVEKGDFQSADDVGKLKATDWGCAIVGFGLVPMAFFGQIGRKYFGLSGLVAGVLIGAAIFAAVMYVSWRQRSEQRELSTEGNVQEVSVESSACFEIDLHNVDPIIAIDIGLNKLLVLQGQWLKDADIYGCPVTSDDPIEEYVNGLPPPNAFPNSKFSIVRNPENGDVLAIRSTGTYLQPVLLEGTLYANQALPQSQLVSGSAESVMGDILNGTDLYDDA